MDRRNRARWPLLAALVLMAGCSTSGPSAPSDAPTAEPSTGCASARVASATLMVLAACATAPVATPQVTEPPVTPPPTPEPTVDPATIPPRGSVDGDEVPDAQCCTGIELTAGRYASPDFVPLAMSVEVGDGWKGYRSENDGVFTFLKGSNALGHGTQWLLLSAVSPGTAHLFLEQLAGTRYLTLGAEEPVEVAGIPGRRIDAVAERNPAELGGPFRVPGCIEIRAMGQITRISHGFVTESVGAHLRIYVLEPARGVDIVAYVEASARTADAFFAEAETVLGTLEFATG